MALDSTAPSRAVMTASRRKIRRARSKTFAARAFDGIITADPLTLSRLARIGSSRKKLVLYNFPISISSRHRAPAPNASTSSTAAAFLNAPEPRPAGSL